MSKSKTYTVAYKRKREGKTDYKRRLTYLKSGKTRIVIRASKNNIQIQAVNFDMDGDKVISTTKSTELKKQGWGFSTGNTPAAYLTGLLFGNKVKDKVKEGIVDLGRNSITKGSRLPAVIKGIADSGIEIKYNESILPSEERISGKDIAKYAKDLSAEKEKYDKQFSKYLKNNQKPELIAEEFEKVKNKIQGSKK
jgi:large subunit ribosomal protein L18